MDDILGRLKEKVHQEVLAEQQEQQEQQKEQEQKQEKDAEIVAIFLSSHW